jgi:hypothetical protein
VRTPKESQPATGTHFLQRAEGGISEDTKKSQRERGTHSLSRAEGGTSKDTKRKATSEGRLLPVEGRWGDQ